MSYLVYGFEHFADFAGRATRTQYWLFHLWFFVLAFLASIMDVFLGTDGFLTDTGLITFLTDLVFLLPLLGVSVRRLHDINKNGAWIFINIVPLIGWLILLAFYCTAGDPDLNDYGPPVGYKYE